MVIYAQSGLGEGIALIGDERFCRGIEYYRERAAVIFVGYYINRAVCHESIATRGIAYGIYFFSLEIFKYEVLEPHLRAYGIAVRIIMAMYYYAVIPRNERKRFFKQNMPLLFRDIIKVCLCILT